MRGARGRQGRKEREGGWDEREQRAGEEEGRCLERGGLARRALTLRSAASQTRLQSPGGTSTTPAASQPPAKRERERSPRGAKGDATARGELGGPSGSPAASVRGVEGLSSAALRQLGPHREEGWGERLARVMQAEGPAPGGSTKNKCAAGSRERPLRAPRGTLLRGSPGDARARLQPCAPPARPNRRPSAAARPAPGWGWPPRRARSGWAPPFCSAPRGAPAPLSSAKRI